jgi:hypothetical protein
VKLITNEIGGRGFRSHPESLQQYSHIALSAVYTVHIGTFHVRVIGSLSVAGNSGYKAGTQRFCCGLSVARNLRRPLHTNGCWGLMKYEFDVTLGGMTFISPSINILKYMDIHTSPMLKRNRNVV